MKKLFLLLLPLIAGACASSSDNEVITNTYPSDLDVALTYAGMPMTFNIENVDYTVSTYPDSKNDLTMDVVVPEYVIKNVSVTTPRTTINLGDLTIGGYKVSGLTFNAIDSTYSRDYSKDGLSAYFAISDTTIIKIKPKYYDLNNDTCEKITVKYKDSVIYINNKFVMGNMPMPIRTSFKCDLRKH